MSVSRHTILVRVDGDGVHCEFVGCSEDTDGDFLHIDEKSARVERDDAFALGLEIAREVQLNETTYATVGYKNLCEGARVTR